MPQEKRKVIAVVSGTITEGTQKATALGFPTINIAYENRELPDAGIYAGALIYDGEEYPGAICLAPNGKLEIYCFQSVPLAHIKEASIAFMQRIGDYIKGGDGEMQQKIARDVAKTKKFFRLHS